MIDEFNAKNAMHDAEKAVEWAKGEAERLTEESLQDPAVFAVLGKVFGDDAVRIGFLEDALEHLGRVVSDANLYCVLKGWVWPDGLKEELISIGIGLATYRAFKKMKGEKVQ